jgi:hypothetical protein
MVKHRTPFTGVGNGKGTNGKSRDSIPITNVYLLFGMEFWLNELYMDVVSDNKENIFQPFSQSSNRAPI